MSTEALFTGDSSNAFHPKINKYSRRLVNSYLSVEERHKHDIEQRERHRQELLAKVEKERQERETFAPVINRRVRGSSVYGEVDSSVNVDSVRALIPKHRPAQLEETFRPVINVKSQRMVANGVGTNAQQQLQEVRQRVQALWRTHAGIGSNEITINGVYAVLKELGLQIPSAVVDKFLLALGIDEAAGLRCVPYDRFSKVFVVVLRAALISPTIESNCPNADARAKSHGVDESPQVCAVSSRASAPTMRRVKRCGSAPPKGGGEEVIDTNCTRSKPLVYDLLRTAQASGINADVPCEEDGDNKSSSSVVSLSRSLRQKSVVSHSRMSGGSPGLSCSPQNPQVDEKRPTQTPSNSLERWTFAPTRKKRVGSTSSALCTEKRSVTLSTRRKAPVTAYKSKEERDLEECTFTPKTDRFHKGRDSLTWWKRGPFIGTEVEKKVFSSTTSSPLVASVDSSVNCPNGGKAKSRSESSGNSYHHRKQTQKLPLDRWISPIPIAAGFDKAVQRMTEARKKIRPAFEEVLRATTDEPQKPLCPTVVTPFLLYSEERQKQREKRKPVLYVDVDLPSGKTGRIGVCRDDKAADLAKSFSNTYGLNDELRKRLESVLAEKLNELFGEHKRTHWL